MPRLVLLEKWVRERSHCDYILVYITHLFKVGFVVDNISACGNTKEKALQMKGFIVISAKLIRRYVNTRQEAVLW